MIKSEEEVRRCGEKYRFCHSDVNCERRAGSLMMEKKNTFANKPEQKAIRGLSFEISDAIRRIRSITSAKKKP